MSHARCAAGIAPLQIETAASDGARRASAAARSDSHEGLLLRSRITLDARTAWALDRWLDEHPILAELYRCKEALHRFYRTRGLARAQQAFTWLTDQMARSSVLEIQRLRRTLMKWRKEILAYFGTGLTNGRTEGFNNKAKLVKKKKGLRI